jgi:hypothetical protein
LASNSLISGLRAATDVEHRERSRRILWIFLLTVCFAVMVAQITDRVRHFISEPVSVQVTVARNSSLIYPAITICNKVTHMHRFPADFMDNVLTMCQLCAAVIVFMSICICNFFQTANYSFRCPMGTKHTPDTRDPLCSKNGNDQLQSVFYLFCMYYTRGF